MDIAKLIIKKLKGNLTEEEESYFQKWLKISADNAFLFSRLEKIKGKEIDISNLDQTDPGRVWKKITEEVKAKKKLKHSTYRLTSILKYAAIFLCFLGLGYGYWAYTVSDTAEPMHQAGAITLQLDNGDMRILSEGNAKSIADREGNVVGISTGEGLNYDDAPLADNPGSHTLKVPYGKRFVIVLSDGSTVHMNAGSTLKYPARFAEGTERHVYLSGEAYFEVNPDSRPFIVTGNEMDVRVLGTKFNMTAYPEDFNSSMVLVEGSVGLNTTDSNYQKENSFLLKPGFKASWDSSDRKIITEKVDTDHYTAWLEGKLVLRQMRFKDILQKLQRHYNVTIFNEFEALNNRVFTATFDIESIEEVLNTFAEETSFAFEINGEQITILKPL
jgi:ferric-dicitrate binding protein FerR (iron transport regulator)